MNLLILLKIRYNKLAGLYALKSEEEIKKLRYQFKSKLVRLLLKKHYGREKIYNIFEFLDGILFLPDDLELKFKEKVKKLVGGEDKMGVSKEMTNLYQVGEKKGKEEMVKRMLKSGLNIEEVIEISDMSKEKIEKIAAGIEH